MAGGRGRRMLSKEEKPMMKVKGRPLVSYVLEAVRDSGCFDAIIALVSSSTPKTAHFLAGEGVQVSNSSGTDYVKDLSGVLDLVKPNSVFITPSDLPLLEGSTVRDIVSMSERCRKPCFSVVVNKALVDRLGVSTEYCFEHGGKTVCYTGVSVIDSSQISGYDAIDEEILLMDEPQLALNVNTIHELGLAESLLKRK